MTDRKQDILTATGAHRAWVGENVAGVPLRSANPLPHAWPTRVPTPANPNARHAAITKSLANFPNYKSWAEKAKTNWKKDKPEKDKPE
jgi:hypothetical protein